ncbi:MAG: response regulator [Thermoanaerobaculales bacterium]|nr:response regulator [Thermoanaerobaculales bacterium]
MVFSPSRLYDLAFSIGESLDLRKNCERFLTELVSTADLTTAAVWLTHDLLAEEESTFGEQAEEAAVLIFGTPEEWFDTKKVALDHPVFSHLKEQPHFSVGADGDVFADVKIERKIHRGVVAVLALGSLGFLHLYSCNRRGVFSAAELRELGRVTSKFTVSVEACLAHNRVMREVALRKRVEVNFQHRREYFRALIENTLDIILVLDYDATIIFAGPSVDRALGYQSSQLEGTNFFELVDPAEVTLHFKNFLTQVRRHGEAPSAEMRIRHADGTWRILAVSSNNLLSSPSVAGIIMNCHDVTERREWLAQVEAARKRAVEASRAKSEFVANVSHEIRNPLNGVIGMASILLESDLNFEQRDCANTIRVSANTLLTIIEDTLDLSKIESGNLKIVNETFSLRENIEGCLDMVVPTAAEKGLELAYLVDGVVADRLTGAVVRVRQVLLNLLSNAVKFTESGEVLVSVSAEAVEKSGKEAGPLEVHISVRDTGIGIDTEGSERLFQPFVQADASTTRRYGGSGLGLAISKRLCEMMGGRIWVASKPGEGSTFSFTFRAEAVEDHAGAGKTEGSLDGMRIVVVHHNRMMRDVLSRYAHDLRLQIVAVASISEAVERGEGSEDVDALIIEEAAFGIADRQALDALRDMGRRMPMIVWRWAIPTTGVRFPSRTRALVLNNPVKPAQLRSVLERALGLEGDGRTAFADTSVDRAPIPLAQDLKILLAEDDDIGRKVALMMLDSLGCHADVVVNGLEAVEAAEKGRYDLMLMDLQMPGLDGVEATRRIREAPLDFQPMIIALTARVTSEDRELCLASGMDGYLTKPIRKEHLRRALLGVTGPNGLEVPLVDDANVDSKRLAVLLRTGGRDMVTELIDLYLDEMPVRLDLLREAVVSGDVDALREAAHKIRGSSSNLGLPDVASAGAILEEIGRSGDLEDADRFLKSVVMAFERAKLGLEAFAENWGGHEQG